jgi:hypothetical protein
MLDAVTATPELTAPPPPARRSLADRDEYGPITGRPGGLFTAPALAHVFGERDELGRRLADWVAREHLL